MTRQKKNHQKILNTFWDMGDFQNAVFGQKQAPFSWPPSSSAFMISVPWAWDVNKYQILVPLIPLKVLGDKITLFIFSSIYPSKVLTATMTPQCLWAQISEPFCKCHFSTSPLWGRSVVSDAVSIFQAKFWKPSICHQGPSEVSREPEFDIYLHPKPMEQIS